MKYLLLILMSLFIFGCAERKLKFKKGDLVYVYDRGICSNAVFNKCKKTGYIENYSWTGNFNGYCYTVKHKGCDVTCSYYNDDIESY